MLGHQLRLIFGKMPLFGKCLQVIENRCFLSGNTPKNAKKSEIHFFKISKIEIFQISKIMFLMFLDDLGHFWIFQNFQKKYFQKKKYHNFFLKIFIFSYVLKIENPKSLELKGRYFAKMVF